MGNIEILSENEVTPENLAMLFQRAFMTASICEEGDVSVQVNGIDVFVFVNEKTKLLRYMAAFEVKESTPLELNLALINKMNNDIVFGRFSIPDFQRDMLVADYFLPYEQGVSKFHVISAITLFTKVVLLAIHTCKKNGLILCQRYD